MAGPGALAPVLEKVAPRRPLIYAATRDNWEAMAELALKYRCPLAVAEPSGLEALAGQVEKISQKGVEDIVLDPGARDFASSLVALTQIRRLALRRTFGPLGNPATPFPGEGARGKVAVLKGELEEELPGWQILVGPPEAMDVGGFLKQYWKN